MSPRIEDQLRDAFAVGAELVRAETLRPAEETVRAKVGGRPNTPERANRAGQRV